MKELVVIGAGALGIQLKHYIDNYSNDKVVAFVDDTYRKGEIISGIEVIGKIMDILNTKDIINIVVAIGYNHLNFKFHLLNNLKSNKSINLYNFIHPSAYIDKSATIEPGVVIFPHAIIDTNVTLKPGVLVNNSALISHDSSIGIGTFIGGNSTIAGRVKIGNRCLIGAGTVIKNDLNIADDVTIGSGSNVFDHVLESGTYVTHSKIIKLK